MEKHFDILVIGTGPAGGTAAARAARAGMKTAIVDSRAFGGTCALRGCNPKKALSNVAAAKHGVDALSGKALTGECLIDWPALIDFKNGFTSEIPESRRESYEKLGIEAFHARAKFTGPNSIDLGGEKASADRIVICSGSRPRPLGIEGEDELMTSDEFLDMKELPPSVIFIGGGYISFEFAHVAARAGAKAFILEAAERPLGPFEPDLVDMLVEASREEGIEIVTGTEVGSLARTGDKLVAKTGRNDNIMFEAEIAVHGAGRIPDVEDLALDKGEVETDAEGIKVDEHLRSVSNPSVYVAGDAGPGGVPLTPVAIMEARAVMEHITGNEEAGPDYRAVPSVVFTSPELAAVGISEQEARRRDIGHEVIFRDTSGTKTTRRHGFTHSALKIITDERKDRVLGAHLLGHNAGEVINLFALAIRHGMSVEELGSLPWTYPTMTSSVMGYL